MAQKIVKSRVNLLGSCKGIVLGQHSLKIVYKSGTQRVNYSEILGFCTIERSLLGHKLEITTDSGVINVSGLSHLKAIPQFNTINFTIKSFIETKIKDTYSKFSKAVVGEYLRESKITEVQSIIEPMVRLFNKNSESWSSHISQDHFDRMKKLSELSPVSNSADSLRTIHTSRVLKGREAFYDSIESNPLTPEQRLSVVQHDDYNMVLAAAGTGKTSVMVAKTTDILERDLANPDEVMVLAYGREAAKELKTRSKERLKKASIPYDLDKQISTFHSRGYQIIAKAQQMSVDEFKNLRMSRLRKDGPRKEFINNWLVTFIEGNEDNLNAFIETVYYAYNPFLSESEEAHQEALKGKKYITLNGVEVKGYQEVLIGNWLFKNGVNYKYEPNYANEIGKDIGFPYHPDFQVKDTNIFIEHFGIDKDGNTRAGINKVKYNQQIKEKIALHKVMGTRLVKTFHYNWCDDELESVLEKQLIDYGVKLNPISKEQIIAAVTQQDFIKNAVKELSATLAAVRSEAIEGYEIQSRLEKAGVQNAKSHMLLIESLRQAYVAELRSRNQIDYDDMILLATDYLRDGMFEPKWKYILVDEFQDISVSRWNFLLELLKAKNCSLTVVGDDWQAIYAFTGGKLEYTTRFKDKLGNHALAMLQKTFRYNNSIADTAGKFVMKNPEQYKKDIVTHTQVNSSEVYLMDNQDEEKDPIQATLNVVEKTILEIYKKDPEASIGILTRYNKTKNAAKERFGKHHGFNNMDFWTLHGSKGLEADYCFILDLNQGFFGFPTERKDNEIVSALMPTIDVYPYAEERRLFYVAITRAKKRCYLIADPKEPSEFVLELLDSEYHLNIVSEHFTPEKLAARKCPKCKTGYMKPKRGVWGVYECSTGLGCLTEAVGCDDCNGIAIKKDKYGECISCKSRFQLCPNCKAPKVVRANKKNRRLFVACSSFRGNEDKSCKFMGSLNPRLQQRLKEKDRVPLN
ncbi:UvrD-helicase domain-containing protein [Pseudoalteromonas shioyasakiensis]|uniref:UvrD-helicase domain-containing protein n=1 Tax=Pseudoalteromonas shioyasakiensis TaxID=1190813 RepID=UPI002117A150|nr:UvrD-helicase domain-containing protein [Pseudoalteromonas shioyasakiensis]MCQ8882155.1 UvrD-helicase domain-containing protein [Pseudoalteromonas shioyasakiensis]